MLFSLINKYISINPKNDILSGLTVALALVPEAVAFALLAGVDPLIGNWRGTNAYTWVVTAFGNDLCGFAIFVNTTNWKTQA
jgi:MFS superfamily sulfate permease-like transporter